MKSFYVAMVLMVIAPLYRIDILIVYPVVFFIFLFQRKSVKESITRSVFLASICDDWILGGCGQIL